MVFTKVNLSLWCKIPLESLHSQWKKEMSPLMQYSSICALGTSSDLEDI